GVAAAIEARRAGLETCLVEQHSRLAAPEALLAEFAASGAEARLDTAAWGIWGHDLAGCEPNAQSWVPTFEQLIIATGSFARPVAFLGWTLPGVAIGGAAPPRGARVAVAGFGSDLTAAVSALERRGIRPVAVLDPEARDGQLPVRAEGDEQLERLVTVRVDADWRAR